MTNRVGKTQRYNIWESAIAVILALSGAYMVWQGLEYGFGSLRRMGPGFFPVAVGAALIILALGIAFETRSSTASNPNLPWRPLIAIAVGLGAFATFINLLGAIPATFMLIFVSMIGDRSVSWKTRLITAAGIAVLGFLFFGIAFRLPISAFWW